MSTTTTATTTTTMPLGELSKEVIDEILVRLPGKSLMRFKTVSKPWLSLITNHSFALRHHSLAKAPNLTSFFLSSFNINFITHLSVRLNGSIEIDSSINLPLSAKNESKSGPPVLVAAGFGIYCVIAEFNGAFHLWNPATAECISFPPPPRDYHQSYGSLFSAKVDCEDGVFSYKVGIVNTTEGNFVLGTQLTQTVLELYSSKTKTWKAIPHVYNAEIYCKDMACVNLNGKAHWFTFCTVWEEDGDYITTFDYENEVLGSIQILLAPEDGKYDMTNGLLSLWDEGFLCLVLCWEKDDSLFIDTWVMREYGVDDSWSKEFTVGPFSIDTKVLGFSSKVHGIFFQEKGSCPTLVKMYDYKSSSVKEFSLPNDYNHQNLKLLIKEHVESVISLEVM